MGEYVFMFGRTLCEPLITVIVPVYNVELYLKKCIDSIVNQTYRNLEIILVDDGSTDSCPKICDEYAKKDTRITVYHKENGGLSDARNYGIDRSTGAFLTFIDSDDYIDNTYVKYLYGLLNKYNTKISSCLCKIVFKDKIQEKKCDVKEEIVDQKDYLGRMCYDSTLFPAWGKMYAKELFEGIRYPKGFVFEDTGTTYKLIFNCDKIACGYESKYNYIMRDVSISHTCNDKVFHLIYLADAMAVDILKKYSDLNKDTLRLQFWARVSTLNRIMNANSYCKERKQIIDFILSRKSDLLQNNDLPMRDKVALRLLSINYIVYKWCWLMYLRFTRGKNC